MIANVVLAGFGNGTVAGSIAYVATRGFDMGEPAEYTASVGRIVKVAKQRRVVSINAGSRVIVVRDQ